MTKSKWNTLILEDEPTDLKLLRNILQKHCPQVVVLAEVSNVEEALACIPKLDINLVFCNALLRKGCAFDLLEKIANLHVLAVILSVDEALTLRAFRQNVFDFLIKPVMPEVLVKMMERLEVHALQYNHHNGVPGEPSSGKINATILLKGFGIQHIVQLADIIHLEGDGNYSTVNLLAGDKILVSKPLKYFEDILPSKYFYRVHQSHIVNLHSVKSVQKGGIQYIKLYNGHTVPLARRKKDPFLVWLARQLQQNEANF